jgi:predicted dehydrogenase
MKDNIHFLVLGAGNRGNEIIKKINNKKLNIFAKGVAEIQPELLEYYKKNNKIPKNKTYKNADLALDDNQDYDFVYIATQADSHSRLAIKALEKGYNILLEKPIDFQKYLKKFKNS